MPPSFNLNEIPDYVLVIVVLWDTIWKGIGLWKAAKQDSKLWFVLLLIMNTLGILPIIYLIYTWKKSEIKNSK